MKKRKLWMLVVSTTLAVQGISQIPNGGFEEWVMEPNFDRPVHWNTNQDAGLIRFERDTLSAEGNFSLKIVSEASSGWQQCTSIASTNVKFSSPIGENKALTFFVRSEPDSTSPAEGIYIGVICRIYSAGFFVHEYEWEAEEAINDFEKVLIPLYYGNIDSMTILIYGGAQDGATDGCHRKSVSWLDDFSIEEINQPYDCAEISTYDLGLPGLYFTNMIRHNDTLAVSGLINNDDDTSDMQSIILMQLDTNGMLIDHFVYTEAEGADNINAFSEKTRGLWRSANGDYLLLSQIGVSGGVLLKVNRNGELVWRRHLYDPHASSQYYRKIVGVDGGYMLAGHKRAANFLNDIFVMKLDLEGNTLWEVKFGDENKKGDFFNDLIVLNTNEIIVSGTTSSGDDPDEERIYTHNIFSIDSTSQLIWHWESEPSNDQLTRGLVRDNNSNWKYTTLYTDNSSSDPLYSLPKFVQRDSAFNLLTETELDDADGMHNYLFNGIALSDGGYLGLGINYESGEPLNQTYAWMVRLDAIGQVIWERKDLAFPGITFSGTQYLHSATELPGGNIIASGSYYSSNDREFGMLIKVDKCGCIDTLCSTTSLLEQIGNFDSQIIVYPNPATDYLDLRLPAGSHAYCIELFDMSGRMTLRYMFQVHGTQRIALDNLNHSGVCAWRVLDQHGHMVDQGKVVVLPE